ncbi:hypothetical protein [Oricola cellulosilytica]|uniref:Uncharacterized protein n=2 Tax=Oricola cellulosilytica TaxID=1429082 RepID=A0A4R0P4J2_9HYPH|nr:hypothetical protein [Oricola cellulosilytica]TCD11813.1 hypothetical protein E0D97_15865 [Oricola cellulosilytica]
MLFLGAVAADADTLTYENERFGTSISFPADVFDRIDPAPSNGDGRTFVSSDDAELIVFARRKADGVTVQSLLKQLVDVASANGIPATYKASGKNWLVVSGYDDNIIYYERHEFGSNGVIHTMTMRYPVRFRDKYDPFVGPIARSLDGP